MNPGQRTSGNLNFVLSHSVTITALAFYLSLLTSTALAVLSHQGLRQYAHSLEKGSLCDSDGCPSPTTQMFAFSSNDLALWFITSVTHFCIYLTNPNLAISQPFFLCSYMGLFIILKKIAQIIWWGAT